MIAILEAHRAGLLGRAHWARNIVSGVVVGVVALPLAMAFAMTNVRNGGSSPLAGIVHALTLVLIVLALAPLAVHILLAALA